MTKKIKEILDYFDYLYPNAKCELDYFDDFSLLCAVVLSAQATDKKVNQVTKKLFINNRTIYDINNLSFEDIYNDIKPLGLANNKARNIKNLASQIIELYDGKVPNDFDLLVKLPGVGIKTANVFLAEFYKIPAIAVDTHVERIAKRLNLANKDDNPAKVQQKLQKQIDKSLWIKSHHQIIFFGRYFCKAKNPNCKDCKLTKYCNYYKL